MRKWLKDYRIFDEWLGIAVLDPGAVYEIKLVAYNGNGESDCSKRLVSLAEDGTTAKNRAGNTV